MRSTGVCYGCMGGWHSWRFWQHLLTWHFFILFICVLLFSRFGPYVRLCIMKSMGWVGMLTYNGSDKTFPTWFFVSFTFLILHWCTTLLWPNFVHGPDGVRWTLWVFFCREWGLNSSVHKILSWMLNIVRLLVTCIWHACTQFYVQLHNCIISLYTCICVYIKPNK